MIRLDITGHARQRWVERIVDPKRYAHLSTCKDNCETCQSLLYDIRMVLQHAGKGIDKEIIYYYDAAIHQNLRITDANFIAAMKEKHGKIDHFDFLYYKTAILLVKKETPPVLLTVMTLDMIDGTVFRNFDTDGLKTAFKRWKFETKQRK